jgi:drug/metabolite transporter (DMT)-like permease
MKRQKVLLFEIVTGLIIICGICMIFKFESRYTEGIVYGLMSALCASIFSIINSKQIQNRPAPLISFYELLGAFTWISVYLYFFDGYTASMRLDLQDLLCLLLLGTVCTSIAYVAGVSVMKDLSAFRVALITNLEPVYGIILAFLFFGKREQMTGGFYVGAAIILAAIFIYPVIKNRNSRSVS